MMASNTRAKSKQQASPPKVIKMKIFLGTWRQSNVMCRQVPILSGFHPLVLVWAHCLTVVCPLGGRFATLQGVLSRVRLRKRVHNRSNGKNSKSHSGSLGVPKHVFLARFVAKSFFDSPDAPETTTTEPWGTKK